MPKILVIDAWHPDESPAGESCDALHNLLQVSPILNVTTIIGNIDAYDMGVGQDGMHPRQAKADENLSMVCPNPFGNRAERRKYELTVDIFPEYDLIIDRHGTRRPGGDNAWCHPGAKRLAWSAVSLFGLRRVIQYPSPVPSAYLPNFLGVDLSPDSSLTAKVLWRGLARLASGEMPKLPPVEQYTAVGAVTSEQAERLGLPMEMESFMPLGGVATDALGYPRGSLVVNYSRTLYAHTGYAGEVVVPVKTLVAAS